ncbi:hypothetical protein [Chitinimonas koreensis]|uniref:hypothetical protein n=1 Tax=Chitinimonas koreensis TaxID=356302 RepID=UPI00146FA3B2|nr:hypothetical protein [Chitinimonas koreensis]QNM96113.1 hypothetical protein H9L41_20230 [Chitinimonas koreensis]
MVIQGAADAAVADRRAAGAMGRADFSPTAAWPGGAVGPKSGLRRGDRAGLGRQERLQPRMVPDELAVIRG